MLKADDEHYRYCSIRKDYDGAASYPAYFLLGQSLIGYVQDGVFYNIIGDGATPSLYDRISAGEILGTPFHIYCATSYTGDRMLNKKLISSAFFTEKTLYSLKLSEKGQDLGTLYFSGDCDPLPRKPSVSSAPDSEDNRALVMRALAESTTRPANYHVDAAYRVDVDGDGTVETILCANSARSASGGLPLDVSVSESGSYLVAQQSPLFSLILMEKDGRLQTIYFKSLGAGEHGFSDLFFSSELLGCFDLDGDGALELCTRTTYHETPVIQVYDLVGDTYSLVIDAVA